MFPTAIATKGGVGGTAGSGSGRPAVANKPSYLTGGTGSGGSLSAKRGTEDLDFFIGDEALAAAAGPGMIRRQDLEDVTEDTHRLWHTLPCSPWASRELGMRGIMLRAGQTDVFCVGSYGAVLVKLDIQIPSC